MTKTDAAELHLRERNALERPTDLDRKGVSEISSSLCRLLADVFALYVKTKNFHWHMSGRHFRDGHRAWHKNLIILRSAKGLAILTITKAGFIGSARGGSGIVIARSGRSGRTRRRGERGVAGGYLYLQPEPGTFRRHFPRGYGNWDQGRRQCGVLR